MFWVLKDAHSTEMDPETPDPVIDMMEEQKKIKMKGGTMRLGAYPCEIKEDTLGPYIFMVKHQLAKGIAIARNSIINILNSLKKPE